MTVGPTCFFQDAGVNEMQPFQAHHRPDKRGTKTAWGSALLVVHKTQNEK